jgi:DNA topoisomerase I
MPGWTRTGRKGAFRYLDERGREIRDAEKLARIEGLVIPPAWRDVWISPRPRAKLQATGYDNAGRKQYLYHPRFRAAQEKAKYERLIRFAEQLPGLRRAMAEHMDRDELDRERVSAVALRVIDLGWLRVGSERYARESRTYGITTLLKRHVTIRGHRIRLRYPGKQGIEVRTTLVDDELADALDGLIGVPGGARVFRYRLDGELCNLTSDRLNEYVKLYLGPEFSAKDFRTWGGTLVAAIELAQVGPADSPAEAKRRIAAVMRKVGEKLGNTPAVARSSYVSPAVVEQYLDGRTVDDFRPRHLRVVGARDVGLNREEQATLSLLRSWRIRASRAAA